MIGRVAVMTSAAVGRAVGGKVAYPVALIALDVIKVSWFCALTRLVSRLPTTLSVRGGGKGRFWYMLAVTTGVLVLAWLSTISVPVAIFIAVVAMKDGSLDDGWRSRVLAVLASVAKPTTSAASDGMTRLDHTSIQETNHVLLLV